MTTVATPPRLESRRAGAAQSIVVWLAAMATVLLASVQLYVLERPVKSDDGGFLNPVLEYVHTGRVVYPAHGPDHAQVMIVHPPVHYWLTGLLMRAGLDFYPAASTLPLLVWIVLVVVVLTSPWPAVLKISFLAAAYITNFELIDLDPSRSELQMAIAWVAALVLLESARLLQWQRLRLFVGGLLLAYASTLHYFALSALGGGVVFAAWLIRDLGWSAGLKRVGWLCGGGAVVLLPYLLLFFLPEYSGIRRLIEDLNAVKTPGQPLSRAIWNAFQYHRETYPASYGFMAPSPAEHQSIFLSLLKPLLLRGLPVVFISTPLLLLWRETRALVIAALPFQLSMLLLFHHKSVPYYRGEFIIYLAGILSLVLVGTCHAVRRRAGSRAAGWLAPVLGIGLLAVVIVDSRVWELYDGARFVDELALARAAGKAVLRQGAIVGGRSVCLWYTSGARFYRNFVSDLIYPPDVSGVDVRSYFDAFDAVAEEPAGSWLTYNKQKLGAVSWYLDGTLDLQGFYAGRKIRGSQYSYFLASTRKHRPLEALFWRGRQLFHFTERAEGDSAVLAIASAHGNAWTTLGAGGEYLLAVAVPPDQQQYLTLHVVTREQAQSFQRQLPCDCTLREVVYGDVSAADPWLTAKSVDYHREMTDIYYTTPELLATQVTRTTEGQRIPLNNVLRGGEMAPVTADGELAYTAPPVASAALVSSPVVELKNPGVQLVTFGLTIRSGMVVISVTDPDTNSTLARLVRYHSQPMLAERLVLDRPTLRRIQVTLWANNAAPVRNRFSIRQLIAASAELSGRSGAVARLSR